MACYRPLKAWYTRERHDTGGRIISFGKHGVFSDLDQALDLPCGKCIGCRLERSRQWALRLMHERESHETASFVTLTYSDEFLPTLPDGSPTLVLSHSQNFVKRLRSHLDERSGAKIRFFCAGEYGEKNQRPHYHLIIFGHNFGLDRIVAGENHRGETLYESPTLTEIWGQGKCIIGEVTFESCAYVARYCLKKVNGVSAESHYNGRKPEYSTMSRRPGIGRGWLEKNFSDVFPSDEVIVRGNACKPPRSYDEVLRKSDPVEFERLKSQRRLDSGVKRRFFESNERHLARVAKLEADSSPARLTVKEVVKQAQAKQLLRKV